MDEYDDCPCCVPILYKLRPDTPQCIWPTLAPTIEPEAFANDAQERNGGLGRLVISWLIAIATSIVVTLVCLLKDRVGENKGTAPHAGISGGISSPRAFRV
jgi:hypothetical protein